MRISFVLGHPAHYHYYKNVINTLIARDYHVRIFIVSKDVLEDLVKTEEWDYINYYPEGRRSARHKSILNLPFLALKSEIRLYKLIKSFDPCIIIGTEITITHVGKLLDIETLIVNEDDSSATIENYFYYPFATRVLLPECCDINLWSRNRTSFNGYQELGYLHPNHFEPDINKVKEFNSELDKYFMIRIVDLSASHDYGKRGLDTRLLDVVIKLLEKHGKVYISSELTSDSRYEKNRLDIPPENILHFLAFAEMVVSDSQTMIAEAALLGTPTIRFNDFVGKLSYLEEIENKYKLGYGVRTSRPMELIEKIRFLLSKNDIKKEWKVRRARLLEEKIDVCNFLIKQITDVLERKKKYA